MLRRLCMQSRQMIGPMIRARPVLGNGCGLSHQKKIYHRAFSCTQQCRNCIEQPLSPAAYEAICEETLESLSSALEELLESVTSEPGVDVELSSGVLTVKLGEAGTYVINKQSPNQQIWLSSPVSGPKRYDYVDDGWVYRHDQQRLHDLLSLELSQLLGTSVDLSSCSHAGR